MADRHKPTEARKQNRHRPGYIPPSRRNPENPDVPRPKGRPRKNEKTERKAWNGRFVAVDGEGWNGKYNLLACSAMSYDLYDAKGLSTKSCLRYLTGWGVRSGDALVGFGLSYDFENILKDIPDEDYLKLLNNEEIEYLNFKLQYIPRKFLQIKVETGKDDANGNPLYKTVFMQDVLGFFQSSFEKALEKWKIETPDIIKEGKALRGDFKNVPVSFIKEYNREELRLLVELMNALRISDREAFQAIGLKPNHTPRIWYGPGSRASNFLRQTHWTAEHPAFDGPVLESLQSDLVKYLAPTLKKVPPKEYFELENEIKLGNIYLSEIKNKYLKIIKEGELNNSEWDLFKKIRKLGGIAPSRSGAWSREYRESLPRTLKRKAGRPLDEVADVLGLSVRDLLDQIQAHTPKTLETLLQQAERESQKDPDFQHVLETLEFLKAEQATLKESLDLPTVNRLQDLLDHPFSAAFYGGRIEASAVGEFKEPLYDYDINSAYPFALSNLPAWNATDLTPVKGFDPQNRIGMYYVEWNCPPGANLYPLPYRSQTGNVFYPREGKGWYMSPEVNAALNVWGDRITVKKGYVLKFTEGYGEGITPLPDELKCTTARKISEMARIRLKAKAEGQTMEKALKLLMNSCYGKTIQQVGSHKFLNAFAASWITSTCRAIISRSVGIDSDQSTISIMTDGILTRNPLPVQLGANLGEFELAPFDHAVQFMPGVYYLHNSSTGKTESKYRGMDKGFNPLEAKKILWEKYSEEKYKNAEGKIKIKKINAYPVKLNCFVTRTLALHQPNAYGKLRYQFVPVEKEEEFSLRSKRLPGRNGYRLFKKENYHFFEAKPANPLELQFIGSMPYELNLQHDEQYDLGMDPEELLDDRHLSSLMEMDRYDLRG